MAMLVSQFRIVSFQTLSVLSVMGNHAAPKLHEFARIGCLPMKRIQKGFDMSPMTTCQISSGRSFHVYPKVATCRGLDCDEVRHNTLISTR